MATQIKVRSAATKASKTSVSTEQSVELVKTLLLVSTSTIAYGRSIFSERHFERRGIEPEDDASFTYDKFITREPINLSQAQKLKKSKGHFCLQRGASDRGDAFLNWLENSVFDAMEKRVLRGFQLRLFEDPDQPNDVLETWTFKIIYPDHAGQAPRVGPIEIKRKDGKPATLSDASSNIDDTVKSIGQQMNLMPYLPEQRHLGIFFWYTDDCDPEYQPPGFEDCELSDLNFPGADICELNTVQLRPYQDGVHGFQVATTHVEKVWSMIPAGLPCDRRHGANADIEMLDDEQVGNAAKISSPSASATPHLARSLTSEPQRSASSMSDVVKASPLDSSNKQTEHAHEDRQVEDATAMAPTIARVEGLTLGEHIITARGVGAPPVPTSSQHSQMSVLSVDERVGQELQSMAQSIATSDRYVGGTQVRQGDNTMLPPSTHARPLLLSSQAQRGHEDSDAQHTLNSIIDDSLIGLESMDLDQMLEIQPLCFSQKYLENLQRRKRRLQDKDEVSVSTTRPRTRASQGQVVPSGNVHCECNTTVEEENMLRCICCGKSQHIECYGYRGKADPRIPSQQACYSCLLPADQDKKLLGEMQSIALERRIVHVIETQGLSSDTAIKNALNMPSIKNVQPYTQKLKHNGFLVEKQGKATTTGRKPKPEWSIVSKGEKCEQLKLDLFDPTTKIAHMFSTESLISREPLATNYYTLTTDPLVRSSSLGIAKLGHPPVQSTMMQFRDRAPGQTAVTTAETSLQASAIAMQNLQVPSTPTSSRRKRSRNDLGPGTDQIGDGDRPKRRMRNSKAKDYLDVSGLMS